MKFGKMAFGIIFIFSGANLFSQITIGGQIAVDVHINAPIPEVIIAERRPNPRIISKPPSPLIHICDHSCDHNTPVYFGEIMNQNGPYGRQIYGVLRAQLQTFTNGLEQLIYEFDNGDILEISIVTANSNDYNYHSYHNCDCEQKNRIIEVLINGNSIELESGSLSLQPQSGGFHTVLNLHSVQEGDFNGTINF